MAAYLTTQEVLDVVVSCFANYNTPNNPKPIKMIAWLRSAKHWPTQQRIQSEPDKAKRDADKATLPAITPSAECAYRSADKVIRHSGLLQFDVDQKDNRHIRNYTDLKAQIAKLPFVAYCGQSVSGTGLWGLVPIAHPDRHGQHFDALKRVFAHYHIILDDKPRSVVSLRGYSYDPNAYFAKQVMLFDLFDVPIPPKARTYDFSHFGDEDDSKLLTRIARMVQEAGDGNRHSMLLKASRLAGGYVAAGRLDEQTIVYALETIASEWPMFSKSQKTIRDGIRYGLASPIYPEERTTPLNINSKMTSRPTYKTYKTTYNADSTNFGPIPATSGQRIATTVTKPESGSVTVVVSTLDDWADNPGSILRPPESSLDRTTEEPCDTYPADWDKPSPADAIPLIREIKVRDKQSFHEWQCQHPYFGKMGLASLQTANQP